MRIINVVAVGLLFITLSSCKTGNSGTVAVKVTPSIMKEIKILDPSVIFFASAINPIRNFSEIKNESEIGFFGLWNEPRCKLFDIIVLLGLRKTNPCNPPFPSGTIYTSMIGNGYFTTLFHSYPSLRLFVTTSSIARCEEIVKTGGGLRVNFMEE